MYIFEKVLGEVFWKRLEKVLEIEKPRLEMYWLNVCLKANIRTLHPSRGWNPAKDEYLPEGRLGKTSSPPGWCLLSWGRRDYLLTLRRGGCRGRCRCRGGRLSARRRAYPKVGVIGAKRPDLATLAVSEGLYPGPEGPGRGHPSCGD